VSLLLLFAAQDAIDHQKRTEFRPQAVDGLFAGMFMLRGREEHHSERLASRLCRWRGGFEQTDRACLYCRLGGKTEKRREQYKAAAQFSSGPAIEKQRRSVRDR
jgi:hypothetical protein